VALSVEVMAQLGTDKDPGHGKLLAQAFGRLLNLGFESLGGLHLLLEMLGALLGALL